MDQESSVYVTGWLEDIDDFYHEALAFLLKYNSPGDLAWVEGDLAWAESWYGRARDVAVDSAGDIIVSGSSDDGETCLNCYTVLKYDTYGYGKWRWFQAGDDYYFGAEALCLGENDTIFATGTRIVGNDYKYFTTRISPEGELEWSDLYDNGSGMCTGEAILCDGDNIYVSGRTGGPNSIVETLKYTTDGNREWATQTTIVGDDIHPALAKDPLGNIYVTGHYDNDIAVHKLDTDGNEVWMATYDGSAYCPEFDDDDDDNNDDNDNDTGSGDDDDDNNDDDDTAPGDDDDDDGCGC